MRCSHIPARSKNRGSAKSRPDIAEDAFGYESFIRASDSTGTPLPEDDLFAGLRSPVS